MRTSMIKPIDYLFRWSSVVALLGGILAAMVMLLVATSGQSGAQTTLEPGQHFIAAGYYHSLALKDGGNSVWAWGENSFGQLGVNSDNDHHTPVQVHGSGNEETLSDITDVDAGEDFSLALKRDDGKVWAWGGNGCGQLGIGDAGEGQVVPVQVKGPDGVGVLNDVKDVAAGDCFSLAVKRNDGTVWGWGHNGYGQLGNGTDPFHIWGWEFTPVQASGLTGVQAIAAGGNHSLAVKGDDGSVWAWGGNSYGQLGDGTKHDSPVPVQVSGLTGVVKNVAGGYHHSLAVEDDGTVWAWGGNSYGQLGDGSTEDSDTPVQIFAITGVRDVAAGYHHSLALRDDGTVWAWGGNAYGQLGTKDTVNHHTPVKVTTSSGLTSRVVDVAAGQYFSLALTEDGTVWAWGGNAHGQLGDGTTHDRHAPVWTGLTGMGPPTASSPPGAAEVTDMEPAPGETGVPRRTNVTATFSEKMDTSTLTKENFRLYQMSANKGPIQITNVSVTPVNTNNGTVVTLDPYGTSGKALRNDTEYVAVITTGVKDWEDNAMAAPEFWRFETGRQMEE